MWCVKVDEEETVGDWEGVEPEPEANVKEETEV